MGLLAHWPVAFALTLAIEVPIFVGLRPVGVARLRAALAGAAGSCVTHPLLWFLWVPLIPGHTLATISGELGVVLVETLLFHWLTGRRSLTGAAAAALLANAASYGAGLLFYLLR